MELVKSLTVNAAPTFTELFRFAIVTVLEVIRKGLLLYPLNLVILLIIICLIFHQLIRLLMPKKAFSKSYVPLRHNQSSPEEVRALKKDAREIQSQLLEMVKKRSQGQSEPQEGSMQNKRSVGDDQLQGMIEKCVREGREKSEMLGMVEQELKKTVVSAYEEMAKMRKM